MRLDPPISWGDVFPGMIVLDVGGVARAVLGRLHRPGYSIIDFFLEGAPQFSVTVEALPYVTTRVVHLDPGDALGTLAAAGLNPEIISSTDTEQERS